MPATKQHFDESFGSGQVDVREVMATDGPALAAVYRYLFDLDLMGTVPGDYVAPASSAYLYYTDEHKHWAEPVKITVAK